jgi:2,5-diamino-6-hydroxy-4-(5-phosphoribosylamino)pyrimidine 1'-reductase
MDLVFHYRLSRGNMLKPWIMSNTAATIDGKIAPFDRSEVKISTTADFRRRDRLRSLVDAIVVGGATVRNDDPSLRVYDESLRYQRTVRGLSENPLGVVLTSECDIPYEGNFLSRQQEPRLIITSRRASSSKVEMYRKKARVIVAGEDCVDLTLAIESLSNIGVRSILLESGGTLLFSALQKNLVDEMFISINPLILGGLMSPTVVDGSGFTFDDCPRPRLIESIDQGDNSIVLHYIFDGTLSRRPARCGSSFL